MVVVLGWWCCGGGTLVVMLQARSVHTPRTLHSRSVQALCTLRYNTTCQTKDMKPEMKHPDIDKATRPIPCNWIQNMLPYL